MLTLLVVEHFKQSMHETYLRHCDMAIPFHWFARKVGEVMGTALMLYAFRPMHLHPQIEAPRMENFGILNLAVDIMVKHNAILTAPITEPWRWWVWVQWHALAVALAELCSRTEGPDVDRAWEVVDYSFQTYADIVADTERGMLWQPIEKLMKKAKQNRHLAQMTKLSLEDQGAAIKNVPAPMPGLGIPSEISMTNPGVQGNLPGRATSHISSAAQQGQWSAGLLGPGSINPIAPTLQDETKTPVTTAGLTGGSIPLEPTTFSSTGDTSFPLDMAWTNWEDFVGEVNFADFDMSDATSGFPLQ